MNVIHFPNSLDITSTSGSTLSQEETFVVKNTLLLLKTENHFKDVFFLGKIFGIERDYYVAFGYKTDAVRDRHFYYSTNGREWSRLPPASPGAVKLIPRVCLRFQGDPNHILDGREAGDSSQTAKALGPVIRLTEEDRLAAVVASIVEDCAVAPRGALTLRTDGRMLPNPFFPGLSLQQGGELQWWMDLSPSLHQPCASGGDSSNTLDTDLPKGSWNVRVRAQGSVCVLQSLQWLGLTAYHLLRTPEHGFVYFGDGIKNTEVTC